MSAEPHEEATNGTCSKNYRPEVSPATVKRLVRDLYGMHVLSIRQLDSYDDCNFHVTVDPKVLENGHITQICPHGYVLKILNSLDSQRPDIVEVKNVMIMTAVEKGVPTPPPVQSVTGQLCCLQALMREHGGIAHTGGQAIEERDTYLIRLLEFLPGRILSSIPLTPEICFQVGEMGANLDLALKDVDVSKWPELLVIWNLRNVTPVRSMFPYIGDKEKTGVIKAVFDLFETRVLDSDNSHLQKGVIHADLHDGNILVAPCNGIPDTSPDSEPAMQVCGLLDFGDATISFLMIEIAISMVYMSIGCPPHLDPDEIAGYALAGYLSKIKLTQREVDLLPLTMCARLAQSITIGCHQSALHPENSYCLTHYDRAWPHLQRLWFRPSSDTVAIWRKIMDTHGVQC